MPTRIMSHVSDHFDIPVRAMVGACRSRNVTIARWTAMYLMREITDEPLKEIGKRFNRSHATPLHAWKKIWKKMHRDPNFARQVRELKSMCSGGSIAKVIRAHGAEEETE